MPPFPKCEPNGGKNPRKENILHPGLHTASPHSEVQKTHLVHVFTEKKSESVSCSVTLSRLLCPWNNSPGKNTGVGCQSLFQGIFPTQESNPGLLHCGQILHHLSHQGSSWKIKKFGFWLLLALLHSVDGNCIISRSA